MNNKLVYNIYCSLLLLLAFTEFLTLIVTRVHILLQVLYFHIILGLQDLLCIRFHVVGIPHFDGGDCMCYNSLHILLAQC